MTNIEHIEKSVCRVTEQKDGGSKTGSGFLCSIDGWVLTAGHIFLQDGETYNSATDAPRSAGINIKFPNSANISAQLLYAEKKNAEGIDFAVLSLQQSPRRILPLHVNLNDSVWPAKVHIAGIGTFISRTVSGAEGTIESNMVDIESGTQTFLHIFAENAVQEGYSGGPVYSWDARAVIGIQVMASSSGLHPNASPLPIAERKTVNAMLISRMVERFPPLQDHLIILRRPFSGFDVIQLLAWYKMNKNGTKGGQQYFNDQRIDEAILPLINEHKSGKSVVRDLNQPILNAIRNTHDRNCFILGEEGGSGKTVTMLKLFSSWLNDCQQTHSIRKIPIYIELRNVVIDETENRRVGGLFVEYLRDIFFSQGSFPNPERLKNDLYQELFSPSCAGTHYILLLDGLNEVPLTGKRIICEEILFWAQKQHIQVIVTSRYKEDLLVEGQDRSSYVDDFGDFLEAQYHQEEEKDFRLFTIQKLEVPVISDYLHNIGVHGTIINQTKANKPLLEILRIPMYLTIFARLYLARPDNNFLNICTKGQLLGVFFDERKARIHKQQVAQEEKIGPAYALQRATEKLENEKSKKIFIFDKIIPFIAFHIAVAQEHPLGMLANDLRELISGLFDLENSVMMKREFKIRQASLRYNPYDKIRLFRKQVGGNCNSEDACELAETVIRFIVEELHLMRVVLMKQTHDVGNMGNWETDTVVYEFLHENLRDFFAAKQLREDAQYLFMPVSSDISLAHRNIPGTVLEFLGDICAEHAFRPYWDVARKEWMMSDPSQPSSLSFLANVLGNLRGKHDENSRVMVSNIIAVMKYSRKNDLSGMDLHSLDLSSTWLGGIRFSRSCENSYLTANFDNATIYAANFLRNGHDGEVTCVRRAKDNPDIIYSGDAFGCIMSWNLQTKTGQKIFHLGVSIRDMQVSSVVGELYLASEHTIYRLQLSNMTISTVYETPAFIQNLRLMDSGICFNTDINPVFWIELKWASEGQICLTSGDMSSMPLWLASCSCEGKDGSWLITGGTSKAHRVQVFEKEKNGTWNMVSVQTVPLPYGNRMNWIELSKDETKVLLCVQNYLYEYSIIDRKLDTETFRLCSGEIRFACYWYDKNGVYNGILYCSGADIVFLNKDYQECTRLNGGNGMCTFAEPFLIKRGPYLKKGQYIFTRQSGIQREVYEKYQLHVNHEIQEFDADTNICSRVFSRNGRVKLGYFLEDRELRLFNTSLGSLCLKNSQWEALQGRHCKFVDYGEMKGTAGFTVQSLGRQVTVYDRYTGEHDVFEVYEGLLIQRCSMKNLQGDMAESEHQEVLRRYGAVLEEEST